MTKEWTVRRDQGVRPVASGTGSAQYARTGRILKVKQGYNPNSSSMGSIIFAFPTAMLAVTAAFGMAAGALASVFVKEDAEPHGKADAGPTTRSAGAEVNDDA